MADNYFEVLGLETAFNIDLITLTHNYKAKIKEQHPDLNNGDLASENSTAMLNEAYKILKNEHKRLIYLLSLHGVSLEENNATLSQDFLMEMMEFNEILMDEEDQNKRNLIFEEVSEIKKSYWQKILSINENIALNKIETKQGYDEIKNILLKQNYVIRLMSNYKMA